MALLQPPPETYHLFDDVMLLSSGRLMYSGPRSEVSSHPEWHIRLFRAACIGALLLLSPLCCSLVMGTAEALANASLLLKWQHEQCPLLPCRS